MTQTISSNINGNLTTNINGTITSVAYNDIYLNQDGNLSMSFDQDALIEQCAQAAKTLLGELVLNTTVGIPYQQAVWVGVPNIQQFSAALRSAFLSVPGVVDVIELNVVSANNTLIYNAIITTIYGTGALNG
jgi:hypothetical protein